MLRLYSPKPHDWVHNIKFRGPNISEICVPLNDRPKVEPDNMKRLKVQQVNQLG